VLHVSVVFKSCDRPNSFWKQLKAPGQSDVDQVLLDNVWLSLEKEDRRPNKTISPMASVAEPLAKDRILALLELAIQVLDREQTLIGEPAILLV